MRYLIVDGNHLAGRSNAALESLTRSDGHKTGALFGTLKGLGYAKWNTKIDTPNLIVCWDGGRSAKRMELLPSYKGNRKKENETEEEKKSKLEYYTQLDVCNKALSYLTCKQIRVRGVEADDLIGIFSNWYANQGHSVVIYSGDKDMHQLVTEKISILSPRDDKILTENDIKQIWGIEHPDDVVFMKSLLGDVGDNIPGVYGIGEKKAAIVYKWRNEPNLELIPEKERKAVVLARSKEQDRKLAVQMIRIPRSWEESFYTLEQSEEIMLQLLQSGKNADMSRFIYILREWELDSLLDNLSSW